MSERKENLIVLFFGTAVPQLIAVPLWAFYFVAHGTERFWNGLKAWDGEWGALSFTLVGFAISFICGVLFFATLFGGNGKYCASCGQRKNN